MPTPHSRHPFRWFVLAGVWMLYFVFGLSITGLAPLVPMIRADLGMNASLMGAALGAWQFVYIFAAIPVGFVLHRFGPGRMLILAACIIAASGFLRSIAASPQMLLAAVGLFGLGGPIISAGAPQMVGRWFEGAERGLAMGVYITGPAIAGIIAYTATHTVVLPWMEGDWRAVLRIWAWVALVAGLLWFFIWRAGRAILPAPAGAGFGDAAEPARASMADMLRHRNVVLLLLSGLCVMTIDHGLRNWLPEIIREKGWPPETAGYLASISVVMGVAGALVFPRLATRARRRAVASLLFAMSAAGTFAMQVPAAAFLVAGLVLAGLASGAMMTVTVLSLMEQEAVGRRHKGLAAGLYFSVAEIGGVGGPLLIGVLRDLSGGFAAGLAMLTMTGMVLLALTAALRR